MNNDKRGCLIPVAPPSNSSLVEREYTLQALRVAIPLPLERGDIEGSDGISVRRATSSPPLFMEGKCTLYGGDVVRLNSFGI